MRRLYFIIFTAIALGGIAFLGKQRFFNSATNLGYGYGQKLLIIHADDLGLCHSVNDAFINACEKGCVNSGSIMVPCNGFEEIAAYASRKTEFDWGIHLTLTSEWPNYKWGGVLDSSQISSIIDSAGYFYATQKEVVENGSVDEIYLEMKAQIQKAIDRGIKLSHIDSHMGVVFKDPKIFRAYLKAGKAFNLSVFVPKNKVSSEYLNIVNEVYGEQFLIDESFMLGNGITLDRIHQSYDAFIRNVDYGINTILLHPGLDNPEFRAIAGQKIAYGSAWRQLDYEYFTETNLVDMLNEYSVNLVSWRELNNRNNLLKELQK